jgi:transketolase
VATHDSIGLGEDGPTHQPVEMVTMLRAMPNCKVLRPADGTECNAAYMTALESDCPSIICLSRQNLPQLEGCNVEGARKGAYVVWRSPEATDGKPAAVIIATGSEVEIAIAGAQATGLAVWVVSAPCLDDFEECSHEYRESVLPQGVPVVSVEASSTHGWARFSHVQVGLHSYGLSAPIEDVYKTLGITSEVVAQRVSDLAAQFGAGSAPMLVAHYPDAVSGMGPKAAAH